MTTVELPRTVFRPKAIRPSVPSRGTPQPERSPLLQMQKAQSAPCCSSPSKLFEPRDPGRLSSWPTDDEDDTSLREFALVERELRATRDLCHPFCHPLALRSSRSEDALCRREEEAAAPGLGGFRNSYPQLVPTRPSNPMASDSFFENDSSWARNTPHNTC
jgi:hypothetical protein